LCKGSEGQNIGATLAPVAVKEFVFAGENP